jgi:hypothetical protein
MEMALAARCVTSRSISPAGAPFPCVCVWWIDAAVGIVRAPLAEPPTPLAALPMDSPPAGMETRGSNFHALAVATTVPSRYLDEQT